MVRMHRNGRRCSLYSNECHIPKLVGFLGVHVVTRFKSSRPHYYLRGLPIGCRDLCITPDVM